MTGVQTCALPIFTQHHPVRRSHRFHPLCHPDLLADRSQPLRTRLTVFYRDYTRAIFTYEWMRIFMFAGLAGERLNRRYLEHVRDLLLKPILAELQEVSGKPPDVEDIWNLHGSLVYLGIRKFIYQLPVPDDVGPVIDRAIDRFLASFAD